MDRLITLRMLQDNDIELFQKWLYSPHVAKWYHQPLDWMEEVQKRDTEFKWIHHFIITLQGKPIGFCQYYEYKQSGETWHGMADVAGTYSIDYMIGEEEYLGKGIGKQTILGLIQKIKAHQNAWRIIVQPEAENKASCGALLSCGFVFDKDNKIYTLPLKGHA